MGSKTVVRRRSFARGMLGLATLVFVSGIVIVVPRAEALGYVIVVAAAGAMLVGAVLMGARADADRS